MKAVRNPPTTNPAQFSSGARQAAISVIPGAIVVLLLYLFFRFSLFHELLAFRAGINLRYNYVIGPAVLLLAFLSGGLIQSVQTRIGMLIAAFSVWLVATIPFSVWRGGSFNTVMGYLQGSLPVFLAIAGILATPLHYRRVIACISLSVPVILADRPGGGDARSSVGFGSLGNPNDLASHLLIVMPFCLYFVLNGKLLSKQWIYGLILTLVAVALTLRTGSRAGLVTLLAISMVFFLKLKLIQKFLFAFGTAVLALMMLAVLPEATRVRYQTIFSNDVEISDEPGARAAEFAVTSGTARKQLFIRSIKQTFYHPIFGVGAGQLMVAEADLAKEEGERARWQQSHNAYTQVSSELGLPGLAIYLAILITCIRELMNLRKQVHRRPDLLWVDNIAFCLLLSFTSYLVVTLFNHLAYRMYLPTLAGLTVALLRIAQTELASSKAPALAREVPRLHRAGHRAWFVPVR
jgi:O-antigen ligase